MNTTHNEQVATAGVFQALDCFPPDQQSRIAKRVFDRYVLRRLETSCSPFRRTRILIALAYAIIGAALLWLSLRLRSHVFSLTPADGPRDLWRFFWIVPFIFFGVSYRAVRWRNFNDTPWPAYWKYLLLVGAGGFLFFVACHSFLEINNWLYYPTSAIVVFWLGRTPGIVDGNIRKFGG